MPTCPHVKAGLWLDELIRMYKSKSAERLCCKHDILICLKCGYKNTESALEQHAKQCHAHKIAIHLKTMETWCFCCKKTPTDNSGYLNYVISKLNELPYFYKRVIPAAVSKQATAGFNATSKPTSSQAVKSTVLSKGTQNIAAVGQKRSKIASSVSGSSKGYGTSLATQKAVVVTRNFRIQCKPKWKQYQDPKYQGEKQPTTNDKTKTATKQHTVHKSPFTRYSSISKASNPMKTINTTNMHNYYHPSIDGIGLNTTRNHLRGTCYLIKDDKERTKTSKANGHKSITQTRNLPTHKWTDKTSHNNSNNSWRTTTHGTRLSFIVPKSTVAPKHTLLHQHKRESYQPSFNDTNAMFTEGKKHHNVLHDDTNEKWNSSNIYDIKQEELFPVASPGTTLMLPEYKPIVGLKNVGNTCFFNSVLQVIYQSRYLHYYISRAVKYPRKSELDGPEGLVEFKITKPPGQLTSALNRFLNETENSAQVRNPAFLLNTLATRYKRFKGFDQQDSHEAFRCLLDGLRMEELKRQQEGVFSKLTGNSLKTLTRKCKTFVDETFGGTLSSTIICRDCFTPTQLTEPFFDLSLSISGLKNRRHGNSEVEDPHRICHFLRSKKLYHQLKEYKENTNFGTLEACLRCYTTLEVLDDDNKFICNACTNSKTNNSLTSPSSSSLDNLALCPVSKLLLLHELPKILVLHLKRFKLGATVTKNNCHIDFPFELDVAPYCTNHCKKLMKNDKIMYSLYGVVVHHGSLHGGHYTAYVKAAAIHDTTMWYYASDSHVRSARVEEIKKSNAYMLFYESTLPID